MKPLRDPARGLGWLLGAPAVAVLGLVVASAPAAADEAAALEKSDCGQRIAELRAAANDKENPKAQFDLGQFHEFGACGLPKDYQSAADLYQKAARQGNVEAEYRLSLINAAGGDNFPSDLAEAEKWADLAARSDSVSGRLAADFKKLLDQVATSGERAEGEKRAADFIASFLKAELARIDCASLHARTTADGGAVVTGTVPDAEQKAKLPQLVARYFPMGRNDIAVDIVPPPICRTLIALDQMKPDGIGKGELGLWLDNGSNQLHQDHPFGLQVRGPDYPVYLRIDYFGFDGKVLHLKPEGAEAPPKLAAGTATLFSKWANDGDWRAGDASSGAELIAVVATPVPLDLGKRQLTEDAADYLRDLKGAFGRIDSAGHPGLVATLLVETSGK
jgi:hypothetical protein